MVMFCAFQLLESHAHAVLVVLAVVGLGTGDRGDVADLDHLLRGRQAAGGGQCGDHRQLQLHLHGLPPKVGMG